MQIECSITSPLFACHRICVFDFNNYMSYMQDVHDLANTLPKLPSTFAKLHSLSTFIVCSENGLIVVMSYFSGPGISYNPTFVCRPAPNTLCLHVSMFITHHRKPVTYS